MLIFASYFALEFSAAAPILKEQAAQFSVLSAAGDTLTGLPAIFILLFIDTVYCTK